MKLGKLQRYINWILPPILAGSIYIVIYISGQFNPEIFSWWIILMYTLEIALAFYLVRKYIKTQFDKKGLEALNWLVFLVGMLIVIGVLLLVYIITKQLLIIFTPQNDSISIWHISLLIAQAVVYGIVLVGIQFMIYFFKGWNASAVRTEQLEKENTRARLESLKLQLNPHFLFNNFNTLDGLIHENQEEASAFLMELAALYRSILKYADDEIILLEKEIELVKHFNYLMEKRFGENFICKIDLAKESLQKYHVPPMSIQLLLENVVKHNRIEDAHPLICTIEQEEDYLVVKNKLAPKKQIQKSSGIGLENLKSRYKLLSNSPIQIENDSQFFKVSIPLISLQSA